MEPREYSETIDAQKYWLILKRRWLAAAGVLGTVVTLASVFVLIQKPVYEAHGKLLFNKTNRTPSLTGLGEGTGQLEALAALESPLDTQAEVIRSVPMIQDTISILQLKDEEGEPMKPEDFIKKLTVEAVAGTDVLHVSFQANEPELAAAVVNKLTEVYIKGDIWSNRAEAASAREFIARELPKTEATVRQADSALRQFKEKYNIIVLNEEASESVRIIANLENQIAQTQAELADATARSLQLRNQVGIDSQEAVSFAALSQAPGVQDVLAQLQEAQSQLAVERTRYQPGYPTVVNLERRVNALNALLQERVAQVTGSNQQVYVGNLQVGELGQTLIEDLVRTEAERIGLTRRVITLTEAQSKYRDRASILPGLEQTQRELERKLQAAQTTYETLLTRLQEIQVAENQNIGNARVISPALVPEKPIAPRKGLILIASFILGVLLATATAIVLDLADRSVKTLKEARELFGYTLLGVIPAFSRPGKSLQGGAEHTISRIVARDLPLSPIAEAYQMLQANLKFLSSDQALEAIVVTSAVSGEGKSEVSANLAVAIAQVGRRVLLIDADMRHPTQHHVWGLTNAIGLSNVIVGPATLNDAIHEVMPHLDVLPSGVIPPNPIALFDSKRMAALIATFAEDYDFVIFDTPPLSGTADAAVLGKMTDGILLVVRPGVVNSTHANAAKEFLTQSGQNVLGMVINGVHTKSEPDSYFYYTRTQANQGDEAKIPVMGEYNSLQTPNKSD